MPVGGRQRTPTFPRSRLRQGLQQWRTTANPPKSIHSGRIWVTTEKQCRWNTVLVFNMWFTKFKTNPLLRIFQSVYSISVPFSESKLPPCFFSVKNPLVFSRQVSGRFDTITVFLCCFFWKQYFGSWSINWFDFWSINHFHMGGASHLHQLINYFSPWCKSGGAKSVFLSSGAILKETQN